MAHISRTTRYCIEHFKRRNQLTCSVDLHLDAAICHLGNYICQLIGTGTEHRKILRPGGHHFPFEFLVSPDNCRRCNTTGRYSTDTCLFYKVTTLHIHSHIIYMFYSVKTPSAEFAKQMFLITSFNSHKQQSISLRSLRHRVFALIHIIRLAASWHRPSPATWFLRAQSLLRPWHAHRCLQD